MTIIDLVRQEVTARQAAELYGLKFDRNGRGFCPWHNDGKHAALQFFQQGTCYCHACHAHGDASDITAKLLGISVKAAAEQIRKDFHLDMPTDKRPDPKTKRRRKRENDAKRVQIQRWGKLCEVVREADERLARYTPDTIDAEFDLILEARCKADLELECMWEDMKHGRAR